MVESQTVVGTKQHGRGTVDAQIIKADIPVQVKDIFALIYIVLEMKSRMYCYNYSQKHLKYIQNLPNSKDILKIFPERDCSSDQQASGDHGLNYLGTSGPNKTSEHHHHHN